MGGRSEREGTRKAGITPGLARALSKNPALTPCECGFPMPRYPGRYPSKCPICSKPRESARKSDDAATSA